MALSARREHHDIIHRGSSWTDLNSTTRMPTVVCKRATETLHVTYDSTGRVVAAKYNGQPLRGRRPRDTISDLLSEALAGPSAAMLAEGPAS